MFYEETNEFKIEIEFQNNIENSVLFKLLPVINNRPTVEIQGL